MFNNSHNLIKREQTYILKRIPVSIHSEDRDINKWPNSNNFEICLPSVYENIQSIRLIQISFPNKLYVFSNNYKNTLLKFSIVNVNTKYSYTIYIEEGTYTPDELAGELLTKIRNIAIDDIADLDFIVSYNKIQNKFYFESNKEFKFIFDETSKFVNPVNYNCSSLINVYEQYINWGLGSYLGFNKRNYDSIQKPSDSRYYLNTDNCINIFGDTNFYMEIDKCNSYDEIYPYNTQTNSYYNNTYGGKCKSAFAKIPINNIIDSDYSYKTIIGSKSLYGFTNFEPPLEKLSKFRFSFRYHDGRLVDFKNQQFNFTIEINTLSNEIGKYFKVRTPEIL